ncbi:acyl-CoA synthetase [Alloalcanivorax mobilis]|uniref:acyl-CoA synthetase n=1 Tax=Alloalcanivorax mobilis TaxID=2019569 RepID=UPI000C76DB9B|nr:long-chain fatty acid--CoA ligase [Alloalcanivorax mobilis]
MRFTSCLTRAVQTRAQYTATIYRDRERSWAEVGQRVARLAAGLQSQGIQPGDRVAILALNSDNYFEAFFAVAWAGAVSVPINTRWAPAEIIYALDDCSPRLLLCDENFVGLVPRLRQETAAGIESVVFMGEGETPAWMADYESLIAEHEPAADAGGEGEELCSICYTGGTTGFSKGVMLSHTNLLYAAVNWIASLHFTEETVFMHSAGFFHMAGSIPAFALTLAGGTHVCLPKFDAELGMRIIQRHRVTYCLFVPTMINMMLNHPRSQEFDLSSLRYIEYGASSMSESVLAAALERLPDCTFIQGYGLTESTALSLSLPWKYHFDSEHQCSKRVATGRVAFGMEVRITVPGGGAELPRGEHGEISLRGPQIMLGYWNQRELTEAAFCHGWLCTGDGGYMDEDGFVYLTDRVKDMIVSGGENVYSREVENAVYKHPAVKDCSVIGIPSEEWGEAVHAVVVFKEGGSASYEEILEHCRSYLAGYKCPRSMEVRDALPLSGAGKPLKAELRAPYWRTAETV